MKQIVILIVVFGQLKVGLDSGYISNNQLEYDFNNFTPQSKARVWWHWISGNVSKSDITKDLEGMKEELIC